MTAGEIEQAALDYLHRGWSVIPMRRRDKRPAIRWQEFQTVRTNEQELHDWFRRWPEDNVGIVTGADKVASNFEFIINNVFSWL